MKQSTVLAVVKVERAESNKGSRGIRSICKVEKCRADIIYLKHGEKFLKIPAGMKYIVHVISC